jgi:hypothetical protein
MKKLIFTLVVASWISSGHAQLQLERAFTAADGTAYFELRNTGRNNLALQCYSLVSYFQNDQERGVFIFNFPEEDLPASSLLTLGKGMNPYNSDATNRRISFTELMTRGLLRKLVFTEGGNSFFDQPITAGETFMNKGNAVQEHLVLVFNGKTLQDASFALTPDRQLPQALRRLPYLNFQTPCRADVSINFERLTALHPQIFNRPGRNQQIGNFPEFQVRQNTASVQIAWQTMRESRSRGFEIERRTASEPWTTVGFVATQAPSGNSDQTLQYLYGDLNPGPGTVQYRLKQVDQDGRSFYSQEQTFTVNQQERAILLYPNPSPDGRATVSIGRLQGLKDIFILDFNGQMVRQWQSVNTTNQSVSQLQPGNYIVKVIDRLTGAVYTDRLLVQKH